MNKKPVYYLQTDARWKNKPYRVKGENSTIGGSGCGPSCAAMLIETLTGKKFTPEDACNWSVKHGYKALNQGTYYGYFKPQFAEFGIKCDMLNMTNTYGKPNHANHAKAFDMLKQGYYIIACMGKGTWTSSGHFIVVWWEDGKVRINDPASTKDIRLNGNPVTFKSQVKYYWWVDARNYNKNGNSETTTVKDVNYIVQVNSSDGLLNCRKYGTTNSDVVTTYKNGTVLKITKESDTWGYTGDGWIYLPYTNKVEEQQKEEEEMTKEQFKEMLEDYLRDLAAEDATWEKDDIAWAQSQGLMQGDEKGRLMPKKFMTRGEFATMLHRYENRKA